jgi:hypothetical protein
MFRNWTAYLRQMYRSGVLHSTRNESFILLDYHWANFGWGRRHTDGMLVPHPHEVWLYTCAGRFKDDWYLEAPLQIVLPRNFKANGTLPTPPSTILDWMVSHNTIFKPIQDPEFQMYHGPIPLDIAKQRDLRTLSTFLPAPISQEDIDIWYPEPMEEDVPENESDDYDDSD